MSIAKDIEKLLLLRDRGELTQAEFKVAKERLLSDGIKVARVVTEKEKPSSSARNSGQAIVIAILSTIAAVFSGTSALLNPTQLSLLAFAMFALASVLNWIQVLKIKFRP